MLSPAVKGPSSDIYSLLSDEECCALVLLPVS